MFLNCPRGSFQVAQRKSVLGVAPVPGFHCFHVIFFFFLSFPAHHPARKITESLMIPQNIVLGEKKGRAFEGPESWREGYSEIILCRALGELVTLN